MSENNNLTIENGFNELEEILKKMEADDVSLEDSFSLYQKGIELIKECNNKIDLVEKQIKIIEGNEKDGEF